MSAIAGRERIAPVGARRRSRAAAQLRPRVFAGGVLWIVLLGALLAGVVAVNVAVLRLNLSLDSAEQERAQLKADIAGVRAELSSASATARIERAALGELGLSPADPESTVYVTLPAK